MFIPTREQLGGLSYRWAQLYGMPHLGAMYFAENIKSTEMTPHARCAKCGKRATNVHHVVPRSKGRNFLLKTPVGMFVLLPPLFALCGSGTTGCHGEFHNGIDIEWRWDSDEHAEDWWSGYLLSHGLKPHDEELWEYGCYIVNGKEWRPEKALEYGYDWDAVAKGRIEDEMIRGAL